MASGLRVSDDLALPADMVTRSFALLAVSGAGKSNVGAVFAEEMYDAELPWVAIDPKGDYWGLRSSGDGTGPGLSVPLFGGLHGDIPLTEHDGPLIANLICDLNLTCILDVSDFPSDAAQTRFLTAFGKTLFDRHRRNPAPRHLILEECDEYLPQVVRGEQARCVGVYTKIVKQGRAFGLGITLISQRSAVINKNALSQASNLIALRTIGTLDRAAIKAWVDYHQASQDVVDSLPQLADGEAWVVSPVWLPAHGLPALQKVQFRRRRTYDSGATPVIGVTSAPAATLADIDLSAILGQMGTAADEAASDDPAVLRKRVADLEKQLAGKAGVRQDDETAQLRRQVRDLTAALDEARSRPPERVEVPVVTPGDVAAFEQATATLRDIAGGVELALSRATVPARAQPIAPKPAPRPQAAPQPPRQVPEEAAASPADDVTLSKAQRAVLTVLAQSPGGRTKSQVATLSGYSVKSSSFDGALSALRSAGLVQRGTPIRITAEGAAVIGDSLEPLPAGPALVEYWMSRLGKAERQLLQVFLAAWPSAVSREDAAEQSGYSVRSSSFDGALSRLRALELIRGWTADETLAEQAAIGAGDS